MNKHQLSQHVAATVKEYHQAAQRVQRDWHDEELVGAAVDALLSGIFNSSKNPTSPEDITYASQAVGIAEQFDQSGSISRQQRKHLSYFIQPYLRAKEAIDLSVQAAVSTVFQAAEPLAPQIQVDGATQKLLNAIAHIQARRTSRVQVTERTVVYRAEHGGVRIDITEPAPAPIF